LCHYWKKNCSINFWNLKSKNFRNLTFKECYLFLRFHAEQKVNPNHRFSLPEDFAVVFAEAAGEVVVGGVFLRLFIANPGWVLRKPKEFLTELLEKWCAMTSTNSPNVSLSLSSQWLSDILYRRMR